MGRSGARLLALFLLGGAAIAAGAALVVYALQPGSAVTSVRFPQDMAKMVEDSYDTVPSRGLPDDWVDCVNNFVSRAPETQIRVPCRSWSAQGVTSTMIALRVGGGLVSVIESRLDTAPYEGRVIVDVVGGTGGEPYAAKEGRTHQFIKQHRDGIISGTSITSIKKAGEFPIGLRFVEETAAYQVLNRGFTIASIGYWGTSVRTLYEQNEFSLAANEVRAVVNHYRDNSGTDPAMITTSFGNHITLAALGKERLERIHVLANVPLMTGVQAHLRRARAEMRELRAQGNESRGWARFNVHKRANDGFVFDYTQMLDHFDHITRFFGDADYPWTDIEPKSLCSRVLIGTKDPRTKDYLEQTPKWPTYVTVVEADHNIEQDAPAIMRSVFADFSDCVLDETSV